MKSLGPGAIVDRYRLVSPAGEGGQGSVWRADDPLRDNAAVALKLVPLAATSPAQVERFRREARTLARLSHPSLPRCHALFEDLKHDVIGIALDFIDGSPLSVLVASERLTPDHRVWIVRHLAAALAYIHDAGLVHRDVKPQNVMIENHFLDHPEDPAGVKLVDFGIAAESHNPRPLTVTGAVIGTVEFLAPELADRNFWKESTDGPERDVFALGVLAYEILHGKHPTGLDGDGAAGDFMMFYREHQSDDDWPPDVKGDALERFFRGALALRASKRARNGADLVALLSGARTGTTRTSKTPTALETAETEAIVTSPQGSARSRRKSSAPFWIGLGVGGAALFGIAFYVSYTRPFPARRPNLDAEEPPNPTTLIPPSRRAPSQLAVTAAAPASSAHAPGGFPTSLSCPADMVAVAGPPPFCLDKHEVTVVEYRKCATCGAAKDAFWTGASFTEAARKEQSGNCTNTRPGLDNYPINCVSYQDAVAYCDSVNKRLPRMAEWRAAKGAVSLCAEVGGVCPLFEWSSDATAQAGYRATRGPSFRYLNAHEGSNVEAARNDDLGFRCAKDPAAR